MTESTRRRVLAASLAAAVLAVATACGTSGAPAAEGTYTVWDPYPQFGGGSAWEKLLKGCGSQAGVKVERTA